uniref:Putative secreted protein n=1 Tax=Anopheles darlingi TaxID=43151 RepID=A0A2M4DQ00_ANODA
MILRWPMVASLGCLRWFLPVLSSLPNGLVPVLASGCLRSALLLCASCWFRWRKSSQNGLHCCSPDCTVALHPARRYLGTFPAPENYRCRRIHHLRSPVRSLGARRLRYRCCV